MSITCSITVPMFGEIQVDRTIHKLIYELNILGVPTMNCCSGLKVDHPRDKYVYNSNGYIQFVYNEELWKYLNSMADVIISADIDVTMSRKISAKNSFIGNNASISILGNSDEDRLRKWGVIVTLLSNFVGKNLELVK